MKRISILRTAGAAGIIAAGLGLSAAPAFGAAQTGNAAGQTFDLGPDPAGLPASCPFANGDANFVFQSGNMVMHDTSNKNGDWGGMTIEGTALFSEGTTPLYQGHLTIWEGGGNNAQSQNEGGFTLDFTGTGDGGTLAIHVNGHNTTNSHGTSTASVNNGTVTCG